MAQVSSADKVAMREQRKKLVRPSFYQDLLFYLSANFLGLFLGPSSLLFLCQVRGQPCQLRIQNYQRTGLGFRSWLSPENCQSSYSINQFTYSHQGGNFGGPRGGGGKSTRKIFIGGKYFKNHIPNICQLLYNSPIFNQSESKG